MAYLVSQLRKNNGQAYMEKLPIVKTFYQSKDPFGQNKVFKDYAIGLSNGGQFKLNQTYYLRFKIARIPQYYYSSNNAEQHYNTAYFQADTLNLTLLLCKNLDEESESSVDETEGEETQVIGTCSVPMAIDIEDPAYSTFSFVFTPVKSFDYLVFKIQRNTYDAIENSVDESDDLERGTSGRTWLIDDIDTNEIETVVRNRSAQSGTTDQIELKVPKHRIFVDYLPSDDLTTILNKGQLCKLINIVDDEKSNSGSKSKIWLKMGYQSRPGSLIVVNQEPIRVGRSGIFELNNGMKIESFMIASPGGAKAGNANIDAFLLDYAYQTE